MSPIRCHIIELHIISQGDASREGQVLEESMPVDIVIIRHGSTETTLELLIVRATLTVMINNSSLKI
jgi:hypothetical protein